MANTIMGPVMEWSITPYPLLLGPGPKIGPVNECARDPLVHDIPGIQTTSLGTYCIGTPSDGSPPHRSTSPDQV